MSDPRPTVLTWLDAPIAKFTTYAESDNARETP